MNDMSIITDEHFNQFIDDSKWLQRNYNELIRVQLRICCNKKS